MKDKKLIQEKNWYEVEVDGKVIAVLEESKQTQKELVRLKNFMGVAIRPASLESLIKFNAKTQLTMKMIVDFHDAAARAERLGHSRRKDIWTLT